MNILIVDDEALARSRLRTLLDDCRDAMPTTVTEAASASEALARLSPNGGHAFDLVLLDIHMPGQDGLALAHAMQALAHPPAVVFVTAHADHAVRAFELDAVDYLTKPVRRERLLQALAKAQRNQRQGAPGAHNEAGAAAAAAGETLLIQDRGRTERLPLAEVLYFKAELKYITVRTAQREYLLEESLTHLEQEFAERFVRIHRNCLVLRSAITGFERKSSNEGDSHWEVILEGLSEHLPISRRQQAIVREFKHL